MPSSKEKKPLFQGSVVRQLANILKETDLTEIEYEVGESRIRVVRQITQNQLVNMGMPFVPPTPLFHTPPSVSEGTESLGSEPSKQTDSQDFSRHPGVIKSPLVGTAYLAPSPEDPTYVQLGSEVKEGETLMIVEAMKVMNPIRAPKAGKVSQILVQNADPVEYGQPLVILE